MNMNRPSLPTHARGLLPVIALTAVQLLGCASNAQVEVILYDPENIRDGAQYAQLAVFENGCPPNDDLWFGHIQGAVLVQTVAAEGEFSDLGPLKKGKYGFVGLLRSNDCAVLGVGCTPVDFDKHRHITIQLDVVKPPAGSCDSTNGESCNGGVCQ